jgi:hypothetical protein
LIRGTAVVGPQSASDVGIFGDVEAQPTLSQVTTDNFANLGDPMIVANIRFRRVLRTACKPRPPIATLNPELTITHVLRHGGWRSPYREMIVFERLSPTPSTVACLAVTGHLIRPLAAVSSSRSSRADDLAELTHDNSSLSSSASLHIFVP